MKTVEYVAGQQIAWQSEGDGEPLLLLHGITEDHRVWDEFVPAWTGQFRVIRFDLPGHGKSSPLPSYSVLTLAQAVADALSALGVSSPRVIGHSLGGIVATMLASLTPLHSVINVDQSLRIAGFIDVVRRIAPRLADHRFVEAMNEEMDELAGPALPAHVREHLKSYRVMERQKVVTDMWLPLVDQDEAAVLRGFLPILAKVRVPYLSLHGDDPAPDYGAWLGSVIPGAATEVWPGLGHWLHRVSPQRFVERVAIFHSNH